MARYLLFRLGQMALVVLGVLTVLFVILRLSGDPVLMLAPPDASPTEIERLRQAFGFSDPVWMQYLRYLRQLSRLDFGRSLIVREPAMSTGRSCITTRAGKVCAHIAMATDAEQTLAKPGMGVDEGLVIMRNEMIRIGALVKG